MKSIEKNWNGIKITEKAIKQIKILSSKNSKIKGIKIEIKKSGCAGFRYKFNLVTKIEKHDLRFTYQGANLYIPVKSMPFIDGTEIDYVNDGLNSLFKFNNPQSKHLCGCGESFSIE